MEAQVPLSTNITVIGGGPAGSYAAAVLAREGFEVTLLEKDVFPRYHIGESMLPSCRPFLRFIDFEEKMKNYGFFPKPGAALKLNQDKREGYTDFTANGPDNAAWNVVRSEFDDLLLRHAAELGVHVHEGVRVEKIHFSPDEPARPVSLAWSKVDGTQGDVSFNWLVDASGRNGLMSTRYLKNRSFNKSLKNVAVWGYWTGAGRYAPGTKRENAPWFEALTDETGWAWFIPLHNGATSVGVVLAEDESKRKKAQYRSESNGKSLSEVQHDCYMADLQRAPGLIQLLGDAEFEGKLMSAGDYSYHASEYAGSHFRIAGDAGAFIDPFFSSGIHLALTGGLSAASTIAASIRGNCTEAEAYGFHSSKVETAYTRFLFVVLGIYKQIRAQQTAVLYEDEEDNFDRAIDSLRPVIQGCADADENLTEAELQNTLDFCKSVLAPNQQKEKEGGAQRQGNLADPEGTDTGAVDKLAGANMGAKGTEPEVDGKNPLELMDDCKRNFGTEIINGFYVKMEQGMLGLVRA
ncbi:putative halogenase [Desarmillaria tabescens]|uniref:Halogenase n=1 Tax=Armillaria tabescens TaxID=1929756 RepID=A0AA39NRB0_ARMTA|nr:putative halogenase [Desarmillaria tabescens]KAK0470422.1 putative halogenase [Desarmillaria tabescens]